jgi:hypothetical protein
MAVRAEAARSIRAVAYGAVADPQSTIERSSGRAFCTDSGGERGVRVNGEPVASARSEACGRTAPGTMMPRMGRMPS